MGLDYTSVSRHNPKIIYAVSSGYGPRGPESGEPAYDYVGLARSGFAKTVAVQDVPNMPIAALADQMGAIMTFSGILIALLTRERLGIGQRVDVSLLGSMMALQGIPIGVYLFFNE